MIDLYVMLIINGKRAFEKVPDRYKQAVLDELHSLGLDENGNPLENALK